MDKSSVPSLFLLAFFFMSAVCNMGFARIDPQGKTWCVAKPSSNDMVLSDIINFARESMVDMKPVEIGGSCYIPNTKLNHASVLMNEYYQSRGRNGWNCEFGGSGLVVITDPSYDKCNYIFDQATK